MYVSARKLRSKIIPGAIAIYCIVAVLGDTKTRAIGHSLPYAARPSFLVRRGSVLVADWNPRARLRTVHIQNAGLRRLRLS